MKFRGTVLFFLTVKEGYSDLLITSYFIHPHDWVGVLREAGKGRGGGYIDSEAVIRYPETLHVP